MSRGLEGLRPDPHQAGGLHPADLVSWEAVYTDGWTLREREGGKYGEIDRSMLAYFQLVSPGETVITLPCDPATGRTGERLVYRRRTAMGAAPGQPFTRKVFFIIGFVGPGPIVAVFPDENRYEEKARFAEGDPHFYPPVPHPNEGEHWHLDVQHKTEAQLQAQQIVLPTGMKLDVMPRTSSRGGSSRS